MTNRIGGPSIPRPPIHLLAAFVTLVLDFIFIIVEIPATIAPPILILICVVIGILGFIAVTLVQRFVAHDDLGAALTKGFVMGIVAGVPYAVAGTIVGVPLLIWAGIHEFMKLLPP